MSGELAQAQSTIQSIINNIENKVQTEGLTLRFAVVSYRDHPPQDSSYVTQALDFTDGHEASEYVKNLKASGGGDEPEAVHDGLMHCCKQLNWVDLPGTPMLRYIFHIADAHPHGKEFGNICETNEGCLCGMRISEVYHEINIKQIHYRLIKARATRQLLHMEEIFKKNIGDFASTDLSHAKEMDVKVSDMIIHEVIPAYAWIWQRTKVYQIKLIIFIYFLSKFPIESH